MGSTFLVELAAGCFMMTAACRADQVGRRYFVLMWVVGSALALVAAIGALEGSRGFVAIQSPRSVLYGILLLLVGVVWLEGGGRGNDGRRYDRLLALAACVCCLEAAHSLVTASIPFELQSLSIIAESWMHVILSAALLGGATAAMLLGHSYLTLTQMPIDPLRRLTKLLIIAILACAVWTTAMLFLARDVVANPPTDPLWMWMMLAVRIGAGLLGLGVLAYMVWDCVKRRSTQSATGILYIAMIFAFFGELSAAELARSYRLWV